MKIDVYKVTCLIKEGSHKDVFFNGGYFGSEEEAKKAVAKNPIKITEDNGIEPMKEYLISKESFDSFQVSEVLNELDNYG